MRGGGRGGKRAAVASAADAALVDVDAELVVAYDRVERNSYSGARRAVIDHLIKRTAQARGCEILTPLVDNIATAEVLISPDPTE